MSNSTQPTNFELTTIVNQLPKTYQKALLRLAKTMLKQSQKGIAKYGTDIDQNTNQSLEYWQNHADEELADFLVYQEKIREILDLKIDCKNDDLDHLLIAENSLNSQKQKLKFNEFKPNDGKSAFGWFTGKYLNPNNLN